MLMSTYPAWNSRPVAVKKNGASHYEVPKSEISWGTDFDSRFLDDFLRNPAKSASHEFRLQPGSSKNGTWITSEEIHRVSNAGTPSSKLELSNKWLAKNRNEHWGKWVVLDGDRLIGVVDDPTDLVAQARKDGVAVPFVTFIEVGSESVWMGWL